MATRAWVTVVLLGIGGVQAAPVTGSADTGSDQAGHRANGALGGAPQISTGNRNLDILLDASSSSAVGPNGAASGARAKAGDRAASAPGIREADLRQAIRADAAVQAEAKAAKRGDARMSVIGLGESELQADASEADPTTQRQWEGQPKPGPTSTGSKASGGESATAQAMREAIEFLRSHRIELFSGIALLALAGVLLRMYSRSRE